MRGKCRCDKHGGRFLSAICCAARACRTPWLLDGRPAGGAIKVAALLVLSNFQRFHLMYMVTTHGGTANLAVMSNPCGARQQRHWISIMSDCVPRVSST